MFIRQKILLISILISQVFIVSCATPERGFRKIASKTDSKMSTENAEWDQYVKSINMQEQQKGCGAKRYLPPSNVKVKGKILLAHGFSACPQQFFEWSEILSKRGFVVYLFLLPGHGKLKHADGKDNFENIPKKKDYREYEILAEVMNKVAISDELPSSIGGLSMGGAVAMNAAATATVAYEKLILFSPFFKMPTFLLRNFVGPGLGNAPLLKNKVIGWGEGCHKELQAGRLGNCDFTLSQVYTNQVYGKYVMSIADKLNPETLVQIVGVEKDKGSDNSATKTIARRIGYKTNENHIFACFYPKGANHSLLSRFDVPHENKFWLNSLLEDATNFIVNDKKVPAQKSSQHEKNFNICDVR